MLDDLSGNRSRVWVGAITTIRLLILTGFRKTEVMVLPRTHVDLDKAKMHTVNGKTCDRRVHLPRSAVEVLAALPREPDNPCHHVKRY